MVDSKGYGYEVAYYNGTHAYFAFPSSPHRRHEQNKNCYRNCGNGQTEFRITFIDHDNNELNCESEEEEKIEF